MLLPGSNLLPPFVVHHRTHVAQQIGVPVLATSDAAIQCLDGGDVGLNVEVGAGKVLGVVALHQVGTLVGEYLQELAEALPFQFRKRAVGQLRRHPCAPPIQAASHRGVAHHLPGLSQAFVKEMFDLHHPLMHAFDLRELVCPGGPLGRDRLQACQLLRPERACGPPGHNTSIARTSPASASVIVPRTFTPNATTGATRASMTAVSDNVTCSAANTRPVSASRTT